ncbi:TPA: hypothetical protein ACXI2C_003522 [Acinetobacter baumannii]|uniref:hypothetical protein n=1 Tax=Acinetobacter pittii TaxID=48296 RepID=UPI001C24D41E|nr:hypothetical protein [Acinetobacter pittii]QXA10003.1 hypothetical protein I6L27_19805 [Acinetobacter pittii]
MMVHKFELGYTPQNLNYLLELNKDRISQKTVYTYIDKSRGVFSKYLLPVSHENHVSMKHADWLKFLELLNYDEH